MAERKSFLVYRDWETSFDSLSDEQMGKLFRVMFAYINRNQLYDGGDPVIRIAFDMVRGTFDRDAEKYRRRCDQNSKNAKKKGRAQSETAPEEADADGHSQTVPEEANAGERCRSQAKRADTDKAIDIDTDRDREKDISASLAAAGPAPAERSAAAGQKEKFGWLADRCQAVTGITPDPAQQKLLGNWYQTYGEAAIERLFDEAKAHNAQRFGYLTAVMRRWERTGVPAAQQPNGRQRGPQPQRQPSPAEAARQQAALAENQRQLEKLLANTAWMETQGGP